MSKIMILGATGSLGKHVTEQAVAANHVVSVLVRTPAKLPADLRDRVTVHQADIAALPASQLAALARNQDALINAAGHVSEGQRFVALVDHIVTSVETLPASERPMCWFLAGAALLDIGDSGRRGCRPSADQEDLLAARGELHAPAIVLTGLAAALPRPDGRGAAGRPRSAPRGERSVAGRNAGCGRGGCRTPPRPVLRAARAGDDRAIRRCRGADAEQPAAREHHVAPPHRSRLAHRDARQEGAVGRHGPQRRALSEHARQGRGRTSRSSSCPGCGRCAGSPRSTPELGAKGAIGD